MVSTKISAQNGYEVRQNKIPISFRREKNLN